MVETLGGAWLEEEAPLGMLLESLCSFQLMSTMGKSASITSILYHGALLLMDPKLTELRTMNQTSEAGS